ncbi:MAG: DUF2782 domain-containing protein [Gammaproteobacteria bacterium]
MGLAFALLAAPVAQAEQDTALAPPTLNKDEALEPEVRIIKHDDKTVHEYRLRGELYLVKIVPKKGKPYYLVDSDGNGSLETETSELDPRLLVPTWVLFRW